ncbi:MAG: transcriptional regulator NrdR, partial [Gammaproteobacteria bacterium]|nr:transcriptional regulator NrdR [Gammaproteobacteria bacterium]
ILDEVAYVRFASVYRSFQDIDEFKREIDSMGKNNRKRAAKKTATSRSK